MGVASTASAGLINRGNGMIYDTDLNITWLSNANLEGGGMHWSAANSWAASLTVGGFTNWRLPTTLQPDATCSNQSGGVSFGYDCTGSELGHLFYSELGGVAGQSITTTHNANYDLFSNIQSFIYWSGEYAGGTGSAWYFGTWSGYQNVITKDNPYFGWAVRTGDVASTSVPEPGIVWLLLAGGLGWVGTRARRRG